ncbi:PP2C family serine/threonine-protein phosphatase [Paenibacillus sabinae]|uniref:PPM-type phosphatase domain-containing protein n=1 Tax=Paenibacillus sabinae T27 TaxID=1268072 RepID=X4ZDS0_9BACL|nr:PP2C family serine/threonine-protein phosphatase [Paenibacillus sabinae]AHV95632.1 hypothetical protein PSAB_03480 [Paenibacillus sabinae T27]
MGVTFDRWGIWGASMIGPLHIKRKLPNQDAWFARQYKWGDVVAVSDGLGSRPRSDIGSTAAVQAVVDAARICGGYPEERVTEFLQLIHAIWLMRIAPYKAGDCGATCLFVIRAGGRSLMAQLGDGLIVAHGERTEPRLLFDDKEDAFVNMTAALNRDFDGAAWRTLVSDARLYDAFLLCTDGISEDLVPEKRVEFAKELYAAYRGIPAPERRRDIRRWLKEWPVPRHTDDKTIACLYREQVDEHGIQAMDR